MTVYVMIGEISRAEVSRLCNEGALLVEVLPRDEYDEVHLPGAVSIPLSQLTRARMTEYSHDLSIITYCFDSE